MTLFRQLMFTIVVIFTLMLVVVMAINFNTTKEYLVNQLASTAQDSANSLSMSISDFMSMEDYTAVESSILAVFDSGYVAEVKVHVYATDAHIVRAEPTQIEGVPDWFINAIDFDVPTANAIVSNGWNELGQVYITGNAGYGYYQLWIASGELLFWFGLIGFLTLAIGAGTLKLIFKPLVAVEKQAEDIQQRRFVKMQTLPKTRELKRVVEAMNRMADKLEKEFEAEAETAQWLQSQAFKDPVSGLGNRHFFDSQASAHFAETDRATDGLILISLIDLAKLNNERGFEAADAFIRASADLVNYKLEECANSSTVARLSGADFIVLIHNIDYESLAKLVENIMASLYKLVATQTTYSEGVANIGAVILSDSIEKSKAMAQVDSALRTARTMGVNQVKVFDLDDDKQVAIGRLAWKDMLEFAIENKAFRLRKQKVAQLADKQILLHEEVFASLEYGGKQYHAGYFISLAEQFDLGDQIDQVIIEKVIEFIESDSLSNPLTINLSASAYVKPSFINWLDKTLSGLSLSTKEKLCFEISEQSVLNTEDNAIILAKTFKQHKIRFGIDNVGKQFSAFQYLQNLMPDYVKVDASYTRMAVGNKSESFFMHTLCKMFNSLHIQVVATGVESESQWEILQRFDIFAGQGYVLGSAIDMD
ncbi:EAL domain-containing protein [Marinomonas sp. MED121]|uniref:bifunctional diguanylate cyclase/phosphodiesterase n=1 Tax=Marinomonas sp. MED121 TaxID=314277 RepID=UPI000560688C|nr:EAL domain-containing protein [Marinomonas sp. MED121]